VKPQNINKLEIIAWILTLSADDPHLASVEAMRRGITSEIEAEGQALNITTAAKRVGLSRPCLYRALATGALRAFYPYVGAHPRITEGELVRWQKTRKASNP